MEDRKKVGLVIVILVLIVTASTLCFGPDEPKDTKNQPPSVAIITDITSGVVPLIINFQADAQDNDGYIIDYDWDFDDDTTSSKEKLFHTFYRIGEYNVTLIVTDNDGAEAFDSIIISALENTKSNELPTAEARADPDTAFEDEEIIFLGSGEDEDGDIINYAWDFDGDDVFDWTSDTTGITEYAYNTSGFYNAVLRVMDDDNAVDTDSVFITIKAEANDPPVAIISKPANESVFEVDEEIQFDGSESYDPDETTLTYNWDFGDGKIALEAKPTHSYSETGSYEVSLIVSDSKSNDTDSITLEIIRIENHPPDAEIVSPEQDDVFEVNTIIVFDGTNSSDPDGDLLFYYWDFGDGSIPQTGATTSHIYTEVGTYTVILRVEDDGNLSDTDTVRILITDQGSLNQPPEAVIDEPENRENFTVSEQIRFNGSSSSDPDGDDLNYTWDFQDGTFGYGVITSHQYSENGTYNVTLTVNDGQYLDTASVVIIVGPGDVINTPPTAIISEPTVLSSYETNETVNCVGNLSFDPEDDQLTYDWDFGDGTEHGDEEITTHKFTSEGVYLIRLTVTDGFYNDSDSVLISIVEGGVNNSAPTAEIVEPSTGQVFSVNEVITFDGSNSSDPDGDKLTYTWYFGDGTQGSGVKTTHKYSTAGLFNVILEVSDGELNDTDRVSLIVRIQIRSSSDSDQNDSEQTYSKSQLGTKMITYFNLRRALIYRLEKQ
jgi:PKD repeat protein